MLVEPKVEKLEPAAEQQSGQPLTIKLLKQHMLIIAMTEELDKFKLIKTSLEEDLSKKNTEN